MPIIFILLSLKNAIITETKKVPKNVFCSASVHSMQISFQEKSTVQIQQHYCFFYIYIYKGFARHKERNLSVQVCLSSTIAGLGSPIFVNLLESERVSFLFLISYFHLDFQFKVILISIKGLLCLFIIYLSSINLVKVLTTF